MVRLSCKNRNLKTIVHLTYSKSESNRALLLNALFPDQITISNLSDSDDTRLLSKAIEGYRSSEKIDVGHAGTSFRFMTAFLATQRKGSWTLTGSDRMKERPIKVLVDALQMMGAKISYMEKEGYPPLSIEGVEELKNEVSIDAQVSSQYISALMMIGSKLSGGLRIDLKGKITSLPYIMMTTAMMHEVGVKVKFEGQTILVPETHALSQTKLSIEADWSAASYWFSLIALANEGASVELIGLNEKSRQGDAQIVGYFKSLGVNAVYRDDKWMLTKSGKPTTEVLELDLSSTPDVAQTLVCTCAGLGVGVNFRGLHTLRIKETDRLTALKEELNKFGVVVTIPSDDQLVMEKGQLLKKPTQPIATYKDHRMAMAFAPLALCVNLSIENEEVVSKSYPKFWQDLQHAVNVEF